MLPWCLNLWPCGKGALGAWDNAVTACSSILRPQSQLGWDGMKVLGLLPAAPSLACPQPWLWCALQVCTPILCPLGLWGPPPPCCPPAQPPHSSGALERHMRRGDPRARSPKPTLSPNSARLGTGQPQPPVLQLVWPSGTPHTPLQWAFPAVPRRLPPPLRSVLLAGVSRLAAPWCSLLPSSVCPTAPAASGASQPGPSPRGSPGSLPHAGLGVRAFCSPSLLSRTCCT